MASGDVACAWPLMSAAPRGAGRRRGAAAPVASAPDRLGEERGGVAARWPGRRRIARHPKREGPGEAEWEAWQTRNAGARPKGGIAGTQWPMPEAEWVAPQGPTPVAMRNGAGSRTPRGPGRRRMGRTAGADARGNEEWRGLADAEAPRPTPDRGGHRCRRERPQMHRPSGPRPRSSTSMGAAPGRAPPSADFSVARGFPGSHGPSNAGRLETNGWPKVNRTGSGLSPRCRWRSG